MTQLESKLDELKYFLVTVYNIPQESYGLKLLDELIKEVQLIEKEQQNEK